MSANASALPFHIVSTSRRTSDPGQSVPGRILLPTAALHACTSASSTLARAPEEPVSGASGASKLHGPARSAAVAGTRAKWAQDGESREPAALRANAVPSIDEEWPRLHAIGDRRHDAQREARHDHTEPEHEAARGSHAH